MISMIDVVQNKPALKPKRIVFLASLGGLLEFYDFVIYALFASIIAQIFFPMSNTLSSLLLTFVTFSIGYLVRPVGGIFFGHIGDKYGRKKTFTATIFIMATSTFLIGFLPSYQQIGIAAPILLLVLRLLQGFSLGGEIPGAITYLSEWMPEKKGLICGFIFCALLNGIVLGSLIHSTLLQSLTPSDILSWGWRLPFILGGLLGIISYLLRKQFYESPAFQSQVKIKFPLKEIIKNHFPTFISGSLFVAVGASMITLFFLFTPSFLTSLLNYPAATVVDSNTIALSFASILVIFCGLLSDKVNKQFLLVSLFILSIIISYVVFDLYAIHTLNLWIPMLLSAVLLALVWGVVPAVLVELFPVPIRFSGIAATYNVGFAIFAGLSPVAALFLIRKTALMQSPSYILIFTAVLGLLGIIIMPKKKRRPSA